MQAGRHAIEVDESRLEAGYCGLLVGELFDLFKDIADNRRDGGEA